MQCEIRVAKNVFSESQRQRMRRNISRSAWLCSVAVSTRDFDSRIGGSNPSKAFKNLVFIISFALMFAGKYLLF